MYRISNVAKKDFPEILKLLKECNLDFKRRIPDLEKAKKLSTVFLLCKSKNTIIATVRAVFDGYYCMIYDLAIYPKFRNQGIGKLLMEEVQRRLKKQGAKYAFLNSNDEAVKFYKKIGYTKPKTNPLIKYF